MKTHSVAALLMVAALLVQPFAGPAFAQSGGALTLSQVERKYPKMSPIHIEKCDRGGNGLYDGSEMNCVSGIYRAMYQDR